MTIPNRFNVRVYGLLINERKEILLTDEFRFGNEMTKFPGGGLEFGEGVHDCLKREFEEELSIDFEPIRLFYLNDFFQTSAFRKTDQMVSIYYTGSTTQAELIPTKIVPFDFEERTEGAQTFRWEAISKINPSHLTFPIDQEVIKRLKIDLL